MKNRILMLKVLDENMKSCNGGSMQFEVGKRYTVKGDIRMCQHGFHLTFQPKNWRGSRVFIAETSKIYDFTTDGMKAVCQNIKLLFESFARTVESL